MDINTETPSVDSNETVVEIDNSPVIEAAPESQPVVEEFTPSYKYKAYGKEFEMDEWARPLLNKDTQPHLTKLFEKAGGFEPLKENYKSLESQFGNYKSAYDELHGVRNQIVSGIEKGDMKSVFKLMGVKDEQVMDYVKAQLEYQALPADQKRQIEERNQLIQYQQMQAQQLNEHQGMVQDLVMQKHELELMTNFNSPKYAPLIETYNQRMGDGNAFKSAVDKVGAYEFHSTGRSMSVPEAIEGAIRMLGLNDYAQNIPGNSPQAASVQNNRPAPKPIVTVNGSSMSPVKKRPMSVTDLENEYKQIVN